MVAVDLTMECELWWWIVIVVAAALTKVCFFQSTLRNKGSYLVTNTIYTVIYSMHSKRKCFTTLRALEHLCKPMFFVCHPS